MADLSRMTHGCGCVDCQQFPQGSIAQDHRAINRLMATLHEKGRRLFAGWLATRRGHGGVVAVAAITGLSRTTVRCGMLDLRAPDDPLAGRVRRRGGGRKQVEKKIRP